MLHILESHLDKEDVFEQLTFLLLLPGVVRTPGRRAVAMDTRSAAVPRLAAFTFHLVNQVDERPQRFPEKQNPEAMQQTCAFVVAELTGAHVKDGRPPSMRTRGKDGFFSQIVLTMNISVVFIHTEQTRIVLTWRNAGPQAAKRCFLGFLSS